MNQLDFSLFTLGGSLLAGLLGSLGSPSEIPA